MPDRGRLAVQIVNYHTLSHLKRCVATVVTDAERSGLDYEINLLDNASGESLDELAGRYPACRVFSAPRNLGFGGGHNLLAAFSEAAPYLLILNPDVEIVHSGTIERLLVVAEGAEAVKAVGPKLLTAAGRAQPYDHGRLHGLRAEIALRGGHSYWRATDVRQEVAWVSGAAMLVERQAFIDVGGFDEQLFLYKEDEDLCLRLRSAGGQVIYEPAIAVRHRGSVVADPHRDMVGSSEYFFAKHYPRRPSRRAYALAHQTLAYLHL